jgi:hypothetical protein
MLYAMIPSVLIATEFPPDAPGGGPAVVRQMLQGFPGKVHWWSARGSFEGHGLKVEGLKIVSCACFPPGKLMPAKKLPKLKAWLMENFWAPLAARDLERTIREVKPDCIWVIPHDWSIIPFWRAIRSRESRAGGREMRWHVTTQDFPDVHGHAKLWGEDLVQRMARMQVEIYSRADSRDATSLPMLDELHRTTGRHGIQMLHQGLEPEDFGYLESRLLPLDPQHSTPPPLQPSTLAPRLSSTVKIAYAGTILREAEFALFVELLEKIRPQPSSLDPRPSTRSVELHLFGSHTYATRPWFNPVWMIEHGNFPDRDLVYALRNCDWGFIPMALDDQDPRYNRFSFPTKFITYLASGLPIITMGHPESSVMKMATAYNVGLTIQTRNPSREDLANALFAPDAKQIYLPEILRCAREQFDAEAMRKKLWKAFGVAK